MRPCLILLASAMLFVGSCACDCEAQSRTTTFGQQFGGFNPNQKLTGHHDAAGGLTYNAGRDISTGPNRPQLWVVISPQFRERGHEHEYRVANWFTSGQPTADGQYRSANPRLRAIQDACAWNYYYSTSPLFAETGLIKAMGNGPYPMVSLTGPGGEVFSSGDGGMLMRGDNIAAIKSIDEMCDYLTVAMERFNPKPQIQGLVESVSGFVRESTQGAFCSQCNTPTGGGDCPNCTPPPNQAPPVTVPAGGGSLPAVVPHKKSLAVEAMVAVTLLTVVAAAIVAVGYFKPFNRGSV